jgi:enterochelin esterase-like enzyme
MRTIPALLLLVWLVYPAPAAAQGGTVEDYHFFSRSLDREMYGRIYLPGAYDPGNPGQRFPVIYFLHGASLGFDSYDALFPILDNLIALRLVKPVILVLPDGLAPPYNGSFYTNSALYGNFEDYITFDLITYADSAYLTRAERGLRGIMGASMGAYGALKIAMRHPELFAGVVGHSGPVNTTMLDIFIPDLEQEDGGTAPYHWSPGPGKSLTNLTFTMAGAFSPNLDAPYQVDFPLDSMARIVPEVMERWRKENVCDIARNFHPVNTLGIRFDCGNLDEYYLYYQNRALNDTLNKYGVPHVYEEYIGTHTSGLPIRVGLSFSWFSTLFQITDAPALAYPPEKEWEVFPNPASGPIRLKYCGSGRFEGNVIFELVSETGESVRQETIFSKDLMIDLSGIPAGYYFYRIITGGRYATGTLLIHP